jgi:hypothetical protein
LVCFRLVIDARLFAVIAEDCGRNLAAGVAVYTGRIDEKISLDVLRQSSPDVGHNPLHLSGLHDGATCGLNSRSDAEKQMMNAAARNDE